MLDHGGHRAARVPDDAPIAVRGVEVGGEDRDGVAGALVLRDQRSQRLTGEQRDVAVGHDDDPADLGQVAQGAVHGVTGAALLVLHDCGSLGRDLGQMCLDLVPPVAHDDDEVVGTERSRGNHGVVDQAAAADGVQDLGDRRLHPGPLAGGEDDHGGRSGGAHARKRSSARRSGAWLRLPAPRRRFQRNWMHLRPCRATVTLDGSRARIRTSIGRTKTDSPALGRPGMAPPG